MFRALSIKPLGQLDVHYLLSPLKSDHFKNKLPPLISQPPGPNEASTNLGQCICPMAVGRAELSVYLLGNFARPEYHLKISNN